MPKLLLCLLVAGCTVGPDYRSPDLAAPETFVNAADVVAADGVAVNQLFTSLGDERLNVLLERALKENLDIAQAAAVLDETRALSGLQLFSWFPTVTTSANSERTRQSAEDPFGFGGGSVAERYRAGFDASWEIDLFGSLRRQSQRIRLLAAADEAAVYAARVAVVAEVAQAWFELQGQSLRLQLLESNLELQQEQVQILAAQLEAGRGTAFDVARARATERSVAALLPLARADVARATQRLAVLTRQPVAELENFIGEQVSLPALPSMIAVGEPGEWLRRRPDLVEAERRLQAASATVGVEMAEFYPKLTLLGSFGWTGQTSSAIGDSDAERWQVAPGLTWRILDFGRVRQRVRAAEARFDGALAGFEQAWLLALEETENALARYRATTERAAALETGVAEAAEASRLAALRFDAGRDSFLAVLDADRSRIELEDQLAQARVDRATALAALYKAFGGDFAVAAAAVAP